MSTERGRRRMARAAEHAGGRACRGRPPDACAFFFSSRRRHTRWNCDWSSDVCSSDLADAWVNLGRLFHEAGDAREAAQHYRKAIELRPDDVIALFNLGVALEDLQMREEAVLAYRTALAAPTARTSAPDCNAQLSKA